MNYEQQGSGSNADFDYLMSCKLEEMYNGAVRKLAIQKNVVCDDCIGTGLRTGTDEQYDDCSSCFGQGLETYNVDNRQQMQIQCRTCGGYGQVIVMQNRCSQCNGKKFVHDRYILEVDIKKGMFHGQKIVFLGEGHQKPNMEFGDFTITLNEMSHRTFKRNKNDLSMVIQLGLTESLCGFQKTIKTLDNRQLIVKSELGKVYTSGDSKYLVNEGMPIYTNPMKKGNLVIHFEVTMPDNIPLKHVPLIEKILPHREKCPAIIEGDDCNMINMEAAPEEEEEPEETLPNDQGEYEDEHVDYNDERNNGYDQYCNQQRYDPYEHRDQHHQDDERYHQDDERYHQDDDQYHQDDEAGRSSPESLESYHPPP